MDSTFRETRLTGESLAVLGRLADLLIPRHEELPSASKAGVAGEWMEKVLDVRPDLVDGLHRALEGARDAVSVSHIRKALAGDLAAWTALTTVVSGAYFLNPEIRALIGYPGQEPQPSDPDETLREAANGLVAGVVARGSAQFRRR
jgi:hypothetical protein